MRRELVLGLMVFVLVIGAFMLGTGITGLVVDDDFTKPLCESNVDCSTPEVCCEFYEEESGVCSAESLCSNISELTKESYFRNPVLKSNPQENENFEFILVIILGALIFGLSAYALMPHITGEYSQYN